MFYSHSNHLIVFIILLFALSLRGLALVTELPLSENVYSDMFIYVSTADAIIKANWTPNHFFQSVGYPLIITLTKLSSKNWGLVLNILQLLASVVSLGFIYALASRCFGRRIGIISLFVGSIHLPWIFLPGFALPETFFTLFLSVAGWYSYKIIKGPATLLDCILWGTSFIFAFWLKGTHVLWAPLLFLGLFILKGKSALKPLIQMGIVLLLGSGIHGGLSYYKTGKFQLSSSAGGLNFVEGKCPSKRNADSIGYWWQSPLYTQLYMNEFKKWDRPFTDSSYFMKEGLKCIEKNPIVLVQSLESIPYLFFGNRMWPFTQSRFSQYFRLYEMFFSLFLVIGLAVMMREVFSNETSMSDKLVWFLPIFSLFLCVYIFKSELRYRTPFDIWFIPTAINGWYLLLQKRSSSTLNSQLLKPETICTYQ